MSSTSDLVGLAWDNMNQQNDSSSGSSTDWGGIISDALKSTATLFDNGLQAYMNVAERVQAMKLLNDQIATNAKNLINPTPASQLSDFFKNNGGMIAAGAIGILLIGALVFRK